MSFISYAQNFEDVMLWRALKHVEHGFYLDVGANDPVEDSITKAFYDHGWSGINIEPLSTHIQALNSQRPRDINLQCVVNDVAGHVELWESEIRGWASAHPDVVKKHIEAGHQGHYITVPSATLSSICEHHKPRDIHFLKVDVEGLEAAVLRSNDWHQFRPWIILIEATLPSSQIESHVEWEFLLLDNGYTFAYADGLNRFYVAQEHDDLRAAFKYPPNVFDAAIKASEYNAMQNLALLHQQATHQPSTSPTTSSNLLEAQATIIDLQTQLLQLQNERQLVEKNSTDRLIEAHLQTKDAQKQAFDLQNKLHHLDKNLTQTEFELESKRTLVTTLTQQLDDLNQLCHHWHTQSNAVQQQVVDLKNSRSWRISAPLRGISTATRHVKQGVKNLLKPPLKATIAFALSHPATKEKALHWINKSPALKTRLRNFSVHQGLIISPSVETFEDHKISFAITRIEQLSPRAKKIYAQLKSQIQTH